MRRRISFLLWIALTLGVGHAAARPEDARVHEELRRGMEALSAGRSGLARVAFEAALEADPENVQVLRLLATLYLGRGGPEEAEPISLQEAQGCLQRALALDPENAETLHLLAVLHAERQEFGEAEAVYLRLARRLDLPEGLVAGHLGGLYLLWGKLELAEVQLQAALGHRAFPQHRVQVYRHLGQLYEQTGRHREAQELYEEALTFVRGVPNEAVALEGEFEAKRAAALAAGAAGLQTAPEAEETAP